VKDDPALQLREGGRHEVVVAHGNSARDDDEIGDPGSATQRRGKVGEPVPDDLHGGGVEIGVGTQRAEQRSVGVANRAPQRDLARPRQLVARDDDRHAGTRRDDELREAGRGVQPNTLRRDELSRFAEIVSASRNLAPPAHVAPSRQGREPNGRAVERLGVFLGHDRVRAVGKLGAGEDARRGAGRERRRGAAGHELECDPKRSARDRLGGAARVAIHGGGVERRQIRCRHGDGRQAQAARRDERYADARQRRRKGCDPGTRRIELEHDGSIADRLAPGVTRDRPPPRRAARRRADRRSRSREGWLGVVDYPGRWSLLYNHRFARWTPAGAGVEQERIRNFCIIAHIDHGKSTLADRLLELTGALTAREMVEQVLDSMDLERERGITIKAHTVTLRHRARDGRDVVLNLIDTPGHVDFSYEVSRSLAACEGALLVVDASQGVEAQTLANAYLAVDQGLELIPVLNKIDLPQSDPERVRQQIEQVIGLDAAGALAISAKTGAGVEGVLDALVESVPPPGGDPDGPLRALIFDASYDPYRGVRCLVRVVDGAVRGGQRIRFMAGGDEGAVEEVGILTPRARPCEVLTAGEVGYLFAGLKELRRVRVGDTVTDAARRAEAPLPGFREAKPMVFAGLYPIDASAFGDLRDALERLSLNDSAFSFVADTSQALGFGFRCGFLGLLHLEIVQQRLEREFNLELITTAPNVAYRVLTTSGEVVEVENPAQLPDAGQVEAIEEPLIAATVLTPDEHLGNVLKLLQERRGEQVRLEYLGGRRVLLEYRLPLAEVVLDFYDKLKSASRGYASFDYQLSGYREGDLVKLDMLVNGESVDAMALIVHRSSAYQRGRALAAKLREMIPRQLFEVVIQAGIGSRVIAREVVKPLRKNVLAKCYGGDVTRKRKLLERQKEGKRRLKRLGRVDIPQEAFLAVFQVGE
jgi:GTP-binding protein LepA